MADKSDKIEIHHPDESVPEEIDYCFMKVIDYCRPFEDNDIVAYEGYDKIQVPQDHVLSPSDILLANNIKARISSKDFLRIWRNKQQIEEWLRKIPADVCLSDTSLNDEGLWENLKGLFAAFCRCNNISYSKTTKIVHKKRPNLIPIVDRVYVAGKYLGDRWLGARDRDISEYLVAATKYIRDDVVHNLSTLKSIQARLRDKKQIDLTLLRIFDILLYQAL
jgi:hypothetical protein